MTENSRMGQSPHADIGAILKRELTAVTTQLLVKPHDRSSDDRLHWQGRTWMRWSFVATMLLLLVLWVGQSVPAAAQGTVTVEKVVSTGNDDPAIAFNGDTIAYTIIINNGTSNQLTDLVILDVLPENVLDSIQCQNARGATPCVLINEVEEIPEPLGGTLTVTTTRQISWTVDSVPPNGTVTRSFTARVIGQADGASFTNVAYASYRERGAVKTQASNEVRLSVRLRIDEGGTTTLSDTPTWFSEDVGGTLSSDWADFDQDGDLDLVLGSTLGTTVYRNNNGQMEQFWSSSRPAYGVRFADVTGDGVPELIAVGDFVRNGDEAINPAQLPGINYIYRYDGATGATSRRFVELSNFPSDVQMVRVEAADFDLDGFVDIVASTNAINPACAVQLYKNDGTGTFATPSCISRAATAALKPVDFDNDGDPDLVLGRFPNQVQILVNENGAFNTQNTVSIEEGVTFLPYDFAWGDFDRDGFLDLAAAFPLMREVRIYRNLGGNSFARPISLRTSVFLTPYAVDWGDFSGDGGLDLAVADKPPRIYTYKGGYTASSFEPFFVLADDVVRGQVWSLRAIDQNNDGDIDLALTDRDGPSLVISNFRPPLRTTLSPIDGVAPFQNSSPASSVTWVDADGDTDLDLIFGAGPATAGAAALNTKLYYNEDGIFPPEAVRSFNGFGPHAVAVGDADGDRDLDIVIASASDLRLQRAGEFLAPFWSKTDAGDKVIAWGDSDGDVDLDLLVATKNGDGGKLELFLNDGTGALGQSPVWSDSLSGIQAVAWGDMDGDGFIDIAVGRDGANVIYRNNRDNTFTRYWIAEAEDNTRAIAWADYDKDGDLDLAVGNFGTAGGPGEVNLLYENIVTGSGHRVFIPHQLGTQAFHTTSLDWGDWDNDGDLDLAVGNYGEPDQIYVNSNSSPGIPQFLWLWSSEESLNTTGIAWGDKDNDGDLDLAISQDGSGLNGIYDNNLVVPSHLPNSGFGVATLINPPLYLYIGRPGSTAAAYHFSSAEVLSGPGRGAIPVSFRLYNPAANVASISAQSFTADALSVVEYQFSLDGGGTWRNATAISATLQPITDELGIGLQGNFIWDTIRDQAIGDNARFRVRVVQADSSGPVQRVSAATTSYPFRVRAITCIWPERPEIRVSPVLRTGAAGDGYDYWIAANEPVRFTGRIAAGTGPINYVWDLDNGVTAQGQIATHRFGNGTYKIRMAVTGDPCPQTRERAMTITLKVGTGVPDLLLPFLRGNTALTETETIASAQEIAPVIEVPTQVEEVKGNIQTDSGALWLRWQPYTGEAEELLLYRIDRDGDPLSEERELVARLPIDATGYQENAPLCDSLYFVVAVRDDLESLPSTSSYYTPACADE